MKKFLIKEVIVYFVMLIILAILTHGSELPSRFSVLELSQAWHPFVYTFIIYVAVGIIRFAVYKIKRFIRAK